ncbi:MAG: C40 family peptidase [Cellulosilyticaceae bacterium]
MLKKSLFILSLLLFSSTISAMTIELDKPVIAYDEPNLNSNKIHLLVAESIQILQDTGTYYKASSKSLNTMSFYIPKADLDIPFGIVTGTDIISTALNYLGTPYIYGGNSLETGVDCSSFVQLIYAKHGYTLNRTSREQFFKDGTFVEASSLLPGDLVFYGQALPSDTGTQYTIQHLGIYMGDQKMIHASTSIRGVVIDGIYDRGFPPLIGFKRIIY